MKKIVLAATLALAPFAALADHPSPMPAAGGPCLVEANLTVGSRGGMVSCLQERLIEDGHLRLSAPTGYFGEITKAALVEWQKEKGVPQTGFFGGLSREAWSSASVPAMPAAAAHEPLDVSSWPSAPSVAIMLHKDAMSGYNLEITAANFRFAPEHVNSAVVANEGHTHLYIDGKKIGRVYGTWTHLPKELFSARTHEVVVTLNANDHSDLAIGGKRIEARATVTVN